MTDILAAAHTIVVKVGSALLVDGDKRGLAPRLAEIAVRRRRRAESAKARQVLLVSSGAIALGRRALKLKSGALKLEESQAAAAAGQVRLAEAYADILAARRHRRGAGLLTVDDTEERRRYLNARATLKTLLELGAVPVINENDTVATAEIRFGDNDRLAARVASMMGADLLILFSDVDGLYSADPSARRGRAPYRRGAPHHARDRGHGGRSGVRRRPRRHGVQTDRGAHRHRRGLRCDHRQGRRPHPLRSDARGGARHTLFRASDDARRRAQALDRRVPQAAGRR